MQGKPALSRQRVRVPKIWKTPQIRLSKPLQSKAKSSFEKRRYRYEIFAQRALAFAKGFQPDAVHAHDFTTLIAAMQIRDEIGTPFVYDSHELWTERNRPNIVVTDEEKVWECETEGKAIREAAFSITVCDSIADHLSQQYSVTKPVVLRNIPYRRRSPAKAVEGLRARFGFNESDFVAVYIGKLAANRGITDILKALPSTSSTVKFVALGPLEPKFWPVFQKMAKELGIKKRVRYHPEVPQEQIVELLADCDLSLTTMNRACLSYAYALPNKLFESIQAHIPVLGPDSPEIVRIIEGFGCGAIYEDGNAADLASKINDLIANQEKLRTLRMNAQKAAQKLCWELEQAKLIEAYEAIKRQEIPAVQEGYLHSPPAAG